MSRLEFTEKDRDEHGRLRITPEPPPTRETSREAVAPGKRQSIASFFRPHNAERAPSQEKTQNPMLVIMCGMLCALALIAGIRAFGMPTTTTPGATIVPSPVTIVADPAPSPTATSETQPLERAVVVYAAPDGTVIGAIEPGRNIVPLSTYGELWVQLDVEESGIVWMRRSDMVSDTVIMATITALPDLAPTPTLVPPTAVPVVVPTAQMVCVETNRGKRCDYGLDPQDVTIATSIAATSKALSAPFQATADANVTHIAATRTAESRTPTYPARRSTNE